MSCKTNAKLDRNDITLVDMKYRAVIANGHP